MSAAQLCRIEPTDDEAVATARRPAVSAGHGEPTRPRALLSVAHELAGIGSWAIDLSSKQILWSPEGQG